jgi:hypothetical protein
VATAEVEVVVVVVAGAEAHPVQTELQALQEREEATASVVA